VSEEKRAEFSPSLMDHGSDSRVSLWSRNPTGTNGAAASFKRYTRLTSTFANFLGIRFMHLRLLRKHPF
jgi:hypothetical protein